LRATLANSSSKPYLEKNPSQKRAGGVAQSEGPEFKPQYCKEKIKENRDGGVAQWWVPSLAPRGRKRRKERGKSLHLPACLSCFD
jgi:hypothetical protein